VDTNVRLWDIRQLSAPVMVMGGHTQAVRRLKCDPFQGNIVATCSYDFTVRIWDISRVQGSTPPLLETISHHSEFTFGLDLCSLTPGKVSRMELRFLIKSLLYSGKLSREKTFTNRYKLASTVYHYPTIE
jgi:peroxin-7